MQFEVDEIAYAILSRIQGKVSDELYNQMYDYLQGLDVELQRFLAEDILEEVIERYSRYSANSKQGLLLPALPFDELGMKYKENSCSYYKSDKQNFCRIESLEQYLC
jgi:hypothetical protein